jgi:hypothetical protein
MRVHLDLNVHPDAEALVFTGEKGEKTCGKAGLPKGFHFHDLRHLGNMLAAEAGASTRELMRRLRQSTMAALVYQHAPQSASARSLTRSTVVSLRSAPRKIKKTRMTAMRTDHLVCSFRSGNGTSMARGGKRPARNR